MKELKHLIYFENLLEDANNELVRKAEAEGDLAIGYTCFHAPEVLLNLGNCFSVRLRAPHTNSMELATYYMANNSCEFSRAASGEGVGGQLLAFSTPLALALTSAKPTTAPLRTWRSCICRERTRRSSSTAIWTSPTLTMRTALSISVNSSPERY